MHSSAKLPGAHNYLLFDKHGRGYNIEAMSTKKYVEKLNGNAIAHTNHCLYPITRCVERPRAPDSQAHCDNF